MNMKQPEKILGIGNDIIEIIRIKKNIEKYKNHFLDRLFTKKEQEYCTKFKQSEACFSGRFAAKEAIAKAFGEGFGKHIHFLDIEILNNEKGKPEVFLSKNLREHFNEPKVHLSISHCKKYATAVAIWAG